MKCAILGIGVTGLSVFEYCKKNNYKVYIWDDTLEVRDKNPNLKDFIVPLADWPYAELDFIVCSPGIPIFYPQKHDILLNSLKYNIPLYSDIDLLLKANPTKKYIAITGTNGKSTTAKICEYVLNYCGFSTICLGNIGIPVLSVDISSYEYVILELSSYQLALMECYDFFCSAILNISADHLEYHGSLEHYQASKYKIYVGQTLNHHVVLNDDLLPNINLNEVNSNIIIISETRKKNTISYNTNMLVDNYFQDSFKEVIAFDMLKYLKGLHNYQNISFVYAIARCCSCSIKDILTAMINAPSLLHRQEVVAKKGNITFINDSKATNIQSTVECLKVYDNIHLILGGLAKGDNLDAFSPYKAKILHCYLIGKSTDLFANLLQTMDISFTKCYEMSVALLLAYKTSKSSFINLVHNLSIGYLRAAYINQDLV